MRVAVRQKARVALDLKATAMIPKAFQSRKSLRNLNIFAVGLSLAALTATLLGRIGSASDPLIQVVGTALPTLLLGALWASLLRISKTVGGTQLRIGWVLSIPLAALNAACAAALTTASEGIEKSLAMFLAGGTLGFVLWGPALLLTLLFFGLPIHWGQKMAKQGLAGEERGEFLVGFAAMLGGAMALTLILAWGTEYGSAMHSIIWRASADRADLWMRSLCAAAITVGGLSAMIALSREQARRTFVAKVEAGAVPGYRVDATEEGKVLLRVSSQGEGSCRFSRTIVRTRPRRRGAARGHARECQAKPNVT
jgi:hypothetical protein